MSTMASPEPNTLLIHAPVGRHFAQIHRDTTGLAESVSLFAEAGLRKGSGVVLIATKANTELFLDRLSRTDLDVESYRKSGQLSLQDAEAMLSRFLRAGMPEWTDFKRVVGPVLDRAQAFGQGAPRAYGEMVNVLWKNGQEAAAIRLEEYWNDLARLYPFSLFCGYMVDCHDENSYSSPLHEIGRTHSHVLSTDDDDAFRNALESASKDIFGVSLHQLVNLATLDEGENRLPLGQRTMLWIVKNKPASSAAVLERARHYYQKNFQGLTA
jgi:hypothetical protein